MPTTAVALVPVARATARRLRSLPPRFGGHDLTRRQLGPTAVARVHAAAQIARAGQRLVLRLQTHRPSEIRIFLSEALAYPALAHVVIEAGAPAWSRNATLEYLSAALPIFSSFLDAAAARDAGRLGAGERETDLFGSRRSHLVGVSHSLRRGALARRGEGWLDQIEPMLECYPVVRLCDVPSHGSERAVETLSEHADHLAAAGRMPSLPRAGTVWAATLRRKAARGATELLCSIDVDAPRRRRARRRRGRVRGSRDIGFV